MELTRQKVLGVEGREGGCEEHSRQKGVEKLKDKYF